MKLFEKKKLYKGNLEQFEQHCWVAFYLRGRVREQARVSFYLHKSVVFPALSKPLKPLKGVFKRMSGYQEWGF